AVLGAKGGGRNVEEALDAASSLLSGLAGGAGIVASPVREAGVRHVEFVALGGGQALAVLVADDGVVENRLMNLAPGVTPSTLREGLDYLRARWEGRRPAGAASGSTAVLGAARRERAAAAARPARDGLAAWSGGAGGGGHDRKLSVRGRGKLLQEVR